MAKYIIRTLGCKTNTCDSICLENELLQSGWTLVQEGEIPEVCIVNSCSVTEEAEKQSCKIAQKLQRTYPQATVFITGCLRQPSAYYDRLRNIQFINLTDKQALAKQIVQRITPGVTDSFYSTHVNASSLVRTRAFVKVQEGCSRYCSYCIVPFLRGSPRSIPIREIIDSVNSQIAKGIREIVLTGTNLGNFSIDSKQSALTILVQKIVNETSVERIRLSSLSPIDITDSLLSLVSDNPRICHHFHVSLQSPLTKILKLMGRAYSTKLVEERLKAISELKDVRGYPFIGMDVISGFPGESNEDFEETVNLLTKWSWSRLHVFPYSEREGTRAATFSNSVPKDVRRKRAGVLRDLSLERMKAVYENVLSTCKHSSTELQDVLLESGVHLFGENWVSGYTKNYFKVLLPVDSIHSLKSNSVISAKPQRIGIDKQKAEVFFYGTNT